jgi:hypothetical protein
MPANPPEVFLKSSVFVEQGPVALLKLFQIRLNLNATLTSSQKLLKNIKIDFKPTVLKSKFLRKDKNKTVSAIQLESIRKQVK